MDKAVHLFESNNIVVVFGTRLDPDHYHQQRRSSYTMQMRSGLVEYSFHLFESNSSYNPFENYLDLLLHQGLRHQMIHRQRWLLIQPASLTLFLLNPYGDQGTCLPSLGREEPVKYTYTLSVVLDNTFYRGTLFHTQTHLPGISYPSEIHLA